MELHPIQEEGAGALYHRTGWSALAYWHNGWACAFIGEGVASVCSILDEARREFPDEAPKVRIRLDDHVRELMRGVLRLSEEKR